MQSTLKYSKEHEWVRSDGGKAYIGITAFAQDSLGDIVFVELPKVGAVLKVGDIIGVVESVKAASEIYTPVSGTVLETNQVLVDEPQRLNEAPFDNWIAVLQLNDATELAQLMDTQAYTQFCDEGA